MANRTVCGEACGSMFGIRGPVIVGLMARVARGRRAYVDIIDVALCAGERGMHPCERVVRVDSVIERGIQPIRCGVAGAAIVREGKLHMAWITGGDVLRTVASVAGGGSPLVDIVDMASGASERGVHSRQSEAGVPQMVERCSEPTVHGVAGLAGGWKLRTDVVDDRREEVFLMAGVASG